MSPENVDLPSMSSSSSEGRAALEQMVRGFMTTQVIHASVRSGLVDALGSQAASAAELAGRVGGDVSSVLRLLRGLVVLGLAKVGDGDCFAATPLVEAFQTGAVGSLRDAALFLGGPSYGAWGELTAAVLGGECAFERATGKPFWEHMNANPQDGTAFNGAMRGMSLGVQQALVGALDVDGETILDVGGGLGHVVAGVLEARPKARGIVFDQPGLERESTAFLAERGLTGRCRFVGGSFFEELPRDGDIHLLKWIIHDWPDDACRRILEASRQAIASDGRLVIVERPLPDLADLDEAARPVVMADLQMLVIGGPGTFQERTDAEYVGLIEASGFRVSERLRLAGGFVAFVAAPS